MSHPDLSGALRLKILNVGQGDAIVAILPGGKRALVVDAFDGVKVLSILEAENIDELALFLSHSDEDHVAGVEYVIDNFEGALVACLFNPDRLKATLRSRHVKRLRFLARATRERPGALVAGFDTGLNDRGRFASVCAPPVAVEVLHPTFDERMSLLGTSTNEASGVLRITYAFGADSAKAVLLAGDIQLTGISCLLDRLGEDVAKLRAEVLKYPHHGSWPKEYPGISQFQGRKERTMADFLKAVDPEVTCLSVGLDNAHGHVCPEVFQALCAIAREGLRLRRVLCTQFTPTCLRKQQACPEARCAGDIEIRIGEGIRGGMEVVPSPGEHARRILSVIDREHAGCSTVQLPGNRASHG